MKPRFSKAQVADYCYSQRRRLEEEYGFDPDNGYAQVTGKGDEANRAYGEYRAYEKLMQTFDLHA